MKRDVERAKMDRNLINLNSYRAALIQLTNLRLNYIEHMTIRQYYAASLFLDGFRFQHLFLPTV